MTPKELQTKLLNITSLRNAYSAYRECTLARIKSDAESHDEADLQRLCDFLNGEIAGLDRERRKLGVAQ